MYGVGMERKLFVALVVIVLISSTGVIMGIVNLGNQFPETTEIYEFEWAVEIGDVITFQIIVTGATYSSHNVVSGPPPYIEFNETIIQAEVIYLPSNTTSLDNATLLSEIIFPIKFTCTFENSSMIPEPVNSRLCELLSWTLVPINNWELLNSSFYKNNFLNPFAYEDQKICSTKLDDSSFNITISVQKDWLHAIGEKWIGAVNLTTGLPYLMSYRDYSFSCTGYGDSIMLTLTRIE